MALNPRFLISPNIQENFVSKDTGLPMAGGSLRFFRDSSRQEPKNVYVLTGAPPNYEYLSIGNQVMLNSAGAASYDFGTGATDVKLYYNPFDSDGILDNYFLEARDANGVLQFTRQAWPDFKSSDSSDDAEDVAFSNFIPNGQFLFRNNVRDNGRISQAVTNIALGGWTFERPENSTSIDNLTFHRFDDYIAFPESSPRYHVRLTNTGGGEGELFKDFRVKFDDVNKFSSQITEPEYTFKFDAKSNAGNFNVQVYLIKNFGDQPGAGAQEETLLDTLELTASYQSFVTTFNFGSNVNKIISENDSDFLQIAVRFPTGSLISSDLTNFALVKGVFSGIAFPNTTTRQSASQSLGGAFPVPDPDGYDIYLKPRLTSTGWEFDRTEIGRVITKSTPDVEVGELLADGSSYSTTGYSTDGIPYARLQEKYWDNASLTPIYGTGENFVTAYSAQDNLDTNQILFTNNESGFAMAVADGVISSGFIFNEIHETPAASTDYGVNAWVTADGAWVQNKVAGTINPINSTITSIDPTKGTTPTNFGVANKYLFEGTIFRRAFGDTKIEGLPVPQEFNVEFVPAAQLANSGNVAKYWTYQTTARAYAVWYKITNESRPSLASSYHYIEVNLGVTDGVETVAAKTVFALNNFQSTDIATVMGSSVTSGGYFTADTVSGEDFYFWYTIDGAGNDPNVDQRTGIKIELLSTDGAQQVAQKTISEINSYQYAVPDYRGMILKGDIGSRPDIGLEDELPFRFNRNNIKKSRTVGSEQLSANRQHYHGDIVSKSVYSEDGSLNPHFTPGNDGASSFSATSPSPQRGNYLSQNKSFIYVGRDHSNTTNSRPANASINYVIKY